MPADFPLHEFSKEILLLINRDTLQIVFANKFATKVLGLSCEELTTLCITDIESSLSDVFFWDEARSGNFVEIHDAPSLYQTASGSLIPVVRSVAFAEYGDRHFLVVTARDTSEQQEKEIGATQLAAQYAAILEASPDGILVMDADGAIVSMNRRFSHIWKIPPDVLSAQKSSAIFNHIFNQVEDRAVFARRIHEIKEDPAAESFDVIRLADGRVIERKSKPQVIDGQIHGLVFSFSDITARVLAEEALREAKERAEVADHAKTAFMSMMSHELRTPLNGTLGMVDLLFMTDLTEEQAEFATVAKTSGNELLTVLNDILDFSMIELHKMEMAQGTVDLVWLLNSLAEQYAGHLKGSEIGFRLDISPKLPIYVLGDAPRLRQVFANLLSNAVKFTKKGAIGISARAYESGKSGAIILRVEVADTGKGISADDLETIFQPFSQIEHFSTREQGGTGLGLVISKRLVEIMGGRISVHSVLGQGSAFRVDIPLIVVEPDNVAAF